MIAVGLKMPEMAISREEAEKLAGPLIELQKYYKVPFDPKWVLWFQLVSAGGAIYVPRVFLMNQRIQVQKAAAKTAINPMHGLRSEDQPAPPSEEAIAEVPLNKIDLSGMA
jgi:hypothetical protein